MKDFKAFNEEYAKRFPGGNYPARQTIQSNIILPVEISCIAVVPYDNEEE